METVAPFLYSKCCSVAPAAIERAKMPRKFGQTLQVVDRQKIVDMRQRRLHAADDWLIGRSAHQWVEPDQPVAAMLQKAQLARQQRAVALFPAVADHQRHRAAAKHAPRPVPVELMQAGADARAAGPVDHLMRGLVDRLVDIAQLELPGNSRQARAKHKALGMLQAVRHTIQKLQQQSGILLHRAADIGDDHERALLELAPLPGQAQRHAAMLRGVARRLIRQRMLAMSSLTCSSSSGVISEKSFRCNTSSALAVPDLSTMSISGSPSRAL